MTSSIIYRHGEKKDLPELLLLIKELAVYERAANEVVNTVEQMEQDGFGTHPIFGFVVAEYEKQLVGASIYYYRYSTWKGRCLHLEDIIVNEPHRGKGIGKTLFEMTLQVARSQGCQRLQWQVLEWNEPAIRFYQKFHARFDSEWINCFIELK